MMLAYFMSIWYNYGYLPYFMDLWYISWLPIWYIFSYFGMLRRETSGNPGMKAFVCAGLRWRRFPVRFDLKKPIIEFILSSLQS
jgi:hypothetical protein